MVLPKRLQYFPSYEMYMTVFKMSWKCYHGIKVYYYNATPYEHEIIVMEVTTTGTFDDILISV